MISFNTVGFTFFGIPPYFFCAVVGFVVAICLNIILIASKHYQLPRHMKILVVSIISLLVFAKMFGCISGVYRALGVHEAITYDTIKNTGIVFYGGLLGLLATYYLGSKTKFIKPGERNSIDILAVSIPLFHAIARIGCFLAGCCYGIEYNGFGAITYSILDNEVVNTANRIPVQLFEAGFNVVIFVYLFHLIRKENWFKKNIMLRYLVLYSVGRFLLEFIRGDAVRGVIYGVSFSQVISILIWIGILIIYIRNKKTMAKENVI